MPELPEVETVARGVHRRVRGDRIVEVWFGSHREPFKNSPAEQARQLQGRTIVRVERAGKHIVCWLSAAAAESPGTTRKQDAEAQWVIHLGMTGRLLVTTPEAPVAPHTHARVGLASGREIRFVDARRFGRLELRAGRKNLFLPPGTEPLGISAEEFAALFRRRKTPIKAALLNQSLLSGVGNIYADESLFRAGIRPRRHAGGLSREELERLRRALVEVLREAIRLGGSSVSDYVDADGARGFFQLQHRVYQRTGEPCLECHTPIRGITLAGRSTHYCPHCQR